jgi:hypothetical protein
MAICNKRPAHFSPFGWTLIPRDYIIGAGNGPPPVLQPANSTARAASGVEDLCKPIS